ncbi:hypothetical protein QE152_g31500 [Popillia japonica]|uniref:Uncharacterized protein n=1 Tax=Popillia japonica TaxID=7064 RepID=A0AAW1J171_POPJA
MMSMMIVGSYVELTRLRLHPTGSRPYCKSYPSECGPDYQLRVMKFRLHLKNIREPQTRAAITGAGKEILEQFCGKIATYFNDGNNII